MKTKNYNAFKFIEANRGISKQKVSQLKKNFLNFGYDENYPILISEEFYIIDGQHRFVACKELGIDVVYSFSKHNTNDYMRSLNVVSSSWELLDYINSYVSEGREDYVLFDKFRRENKFTVTVGLVVFCTLTKSKDIRFGLDLKINPNHNKVAETLKRFNLLKFSNTKNFATAICSILSKNISEKHLNLLIEKQLLITEMASVGQYYLVFEGIINNRRGVRENVYFSR